MDFFKCHLCGTAFDTGSFTPRMMPDCGHTFCQTCISQRIMSGHVVCPEDDSIYQNHDNINDFPINTTLVGILKNKIVQPAYKQSAIPSIQKTIPNISNQYRSNEIQTVSKQRIEPINQSNVWQTSRKEPEVKERETKLECTISQNKSFEILPQWKKNEEDELKRLLTPSDFLQNLLGSLHEQQPQKNDYQSQIYEQQPQYEQQSQKFEQQPQYEQQSQKFEQKTQYEQQSQKFEQKTQIQQQQLLFDTKLSSFNLEQNNNPQQFNFDPSLQEQLNKKQPSSLQQQYQSLQTNSTHQPTNATPKQYINSLGVQEIINQKENLFNDKIITKFDDLISKLQNRKDQVLQDTHVIFQRIQQGVTSAQDHNQAIHTDKDSVDEYIEKILQKVQPEFLLQIELIIPRYCTIRNQLETVDFTIPHKRVPSIEIQKLQKFPVFTKQTKQFQTSSSEEFCTPKESVPQQEQISITNPTFGKVSQLNQQFQTKTEPDETIFHTFENDRLQSFTQPTKYDQNESLPKSGQQKLHQNFSIPYDITNQRLNSDGIPKSSWHQKDKSPPSRRIFDNEPYASPLTRVVQPLFTTPYKNLLNSQCLILQQTLDNLNKGVNQETINLKNQLIGDLEIQQLADSLKITTSFVRNISLSRNLITNDGFLILIEGIRKNKTIKTINLKRNRLDEKCISILQQEYQKSKSNYLSQLCLKGNMINSQLYLKEIGKIQNLGIVIYM